IADGEGQWKDQNGILVSELDGCIDIDISATPFTNTLPIRRLNLKQGEAADLSVVYIAVPELAPRKVRQRYTCLEPGKIYRYEGLDSGFAAEITVDDDGLVIDYPGIFRRMSS
ncbi:MAG: putative glycolipid-binding domain-containing protein, partial [Alphaproteobacteria bacterium]